MTAKEKYSRFCSAQPDIPVYMRDWWLDCVCHPGRWDVLLYENNEGDIEAFMTLYIPYEGVIAMPEYTRTMGVWFNPSIKEELYRKELYRKQKICTYFIERLPGHRSYLQLFDPSFTDWLPFYWKGFKQTTRYNYILPDIADPDRLWASFNKIKSDVKKAQRRFGLTIKRGVSIDELIRIDKETYKRQSIKEPGTAPLKRLAAAAKERNQGDIWGAYDAEGRLHAVLFFVWQESSTYAIACGRASDIPNTCATTLLIWESIRFASTVSKAYDFHGSMLPGVEFINREFGAVQYPYFQLHKGKRGISKLFNAVKAKITKR